MVTNTRRLKFTWKYLTRLHFWTRIGNKYAVATSRFLLPLCYHFNTYHNSDTHDAISIRRYGLGIYQPLLLDSAYADDEPRLSSDAQYPLVFQKYLHTSASEELENLGNEIDDDDDVAATEKHHSI